MDDTSVCTPLLAETDAQNNTTSSPHAASATDADKVINTKTDSTQVEVDKSEEELLKSLLTDDYCHVCEAVLLFEYQRLSHYEGKKHAQKLRVYLQAKRAEKMNKESTGPQWTMTTDKDHFCELCNKVFSSQVVARSHYEGKVHIKNLRKQGLQPPGIDKCTEMHTLPSLTWDPDNADQKSASESVMEHLQDPTATAATPGTEVDLKDPNKYCVLCAASFNNPQMALQHYNGRKHQRNQSRQELLRELGDNVQQANSLMCHMCSVQFNSVEMYQAHMQGNKHQIREKKVIDLCKSQQKNYNTFADELSDYIQVQKARGITPKTGQVLRPGDTEKEDEEDEEEEEKEEIVLNKGGIIELNKPMPLLPTSNPPHHSRLGCYKPDVAWRPPYRGPPWPSHGLVHNCPAPPPFTSRPIKRRRRRKQSSSSSYSTSSSDSSSYSSSYSSSTSDSDGTEYRHKRRIRRSRRKRDKRARDENSDKEEKRRKRRRREREKESEERRRGESGESEEERRRKNRKYQGKQRRRDKKFREEDFEADGGERVTDNLMPGDVMESRKETEVHVGAEITVEQGDSGQDGQAKTKYRKEKKKTKEKVDTRTEEEKLWDDSILGC